MSFKKAVIIVCDTPGCKASATVEVASENEANEIIKANKWKATHKGKRHTCQWCVEAGK